LIYPPNTPNKNENFLEKKNWFLFGLLGGKIKTKIFYRGVNQKKYFTGGKTENDLYYRGVKTY